MFRFSLRSFLLAFTAFAVVFPIGYRWPYHAIRTPSKESRRDPECGMLYYPDDDWKFSRVEGSWQRQWIGAPLEHGLMKKYDAGGNLVIEQQFRNGKPHGLFREYDRGFLFEEGHFENGLKTGLWIRRRNPNWERQELLQNWTREGEAIFRGFGTVRRATFHDDRLIAVDGQSVVATLGELYFAAEQYGDPLHKALTSSMPLDFEDTRLADLVVFFADCAKIPVGLDDPVDGNLRITEWWDDLQFAEALVIVCQPRGLSASCRDGEIHLAAVDSSADLKVFPRSP